MPWGYICGKWWGPQNKQPILFLHGWQDNAGSFDRLIPLLPTDLSILCIDFPGHGFSSHLPKGDFYYLFWNGLIIVRRIVKYFGWEKVSIVGHSLGGAVGFLYAASFPEEVEKLVSLDIACPRVTSPKVLAAQCGDSINRYLKYETLTDESLPSYMYDEMVNVALDGYKGSVSREGIEVLLKRGMKPVEGKEGYYYFSRDVRLKAAGLAMPSLDIVLEFAGRITCDYLNIKAKEGLKFDNPEIYYEVLDHIKKSSRSFSFHEVPGTHHIHLNNPEKIAGILADFLTGNCTNNSCHPDNIVH
ncbi:hypothetical protein AAG570_009474 [Ranatra chinensis]|uniref:AB hydrolase-1 domain-containing protein n=1 Tax=Ranatra chinensis TaxID=642074 RepID=A0ABD0YP66_9HEMI